MLKDLKNRLLRLDGDQSGAVAFLVLAAILFVMMMAWVIFDAQGSARDAIDVQVSADTAAWSQSAVEARSMNMIAFANVAKRIVYGMVSYYHAIWAAFVELLAAAIAVTIACWIADIPLLGTITAICEKITEFAVEVAAMMVRELPDLLTLEGSVFRNEFLEDMKAFDAYQAYMVELTPWWSWAEAFSRGSRNGATVAAAWPVPKNLPDIPGFAGTEEVDALPVKKPDTVTSLVDMCFMIYTEGDFLFYAAEYFVKNEVNDAGNWKKMLAHAIVTALAPLNVLPGCVLAGITMGGDDAMAPYYLDLDVNWMRATSNMVFTYDPNSKRFSNSGDRQKYGYLSPDYSAVSRAVYGGGGSFAMARSEISYQTGTPDAWHTRWTARMRPIALPGEWSADENIDLLNAWHDVMPYIAIGGALMSIGSVIDGDFDAGAIISSTGADWFKVEGAMGGLTDENIEGFAK